METIIYEGVVTALSSITHNGGQSFGIESKLRREKFVQPDGTVEEVPLLSGNGLRGANTLFKPVYDWNFSDVWKYIADEDLRYSKIYDYQLKKNFSINEMRISSLIHERSFKSLCELPEFEPKTYEKLCARIKGIAFAQEVGKNAKVFRARKLPKNFKSWMVYRDFLLDTHTDALHKPIFEKRFAKHLNNEFVARQQCRQLLLNDYENNLPIENKPDPREELVRYYMEVL